MGLSRFFYPQAVLVLIILLGNTFAARPEQRDLTCLCDQDNGDCLAGGRSLVAKNLPDGETTTYNLCEDANCNPDGNLTELQVKDPDKGTCATTSCTCSTDAAGSQDTPCTWVPSGTYWKCPYDDINFNCSTMTIVKPSADYFKTVVASAIFDSPGQDTEQYEFVSCFDARSCDVCNGILCLHQHTMVDVPGGVKQAMDIYKGDFLLDEKGLPLQVLNTVKSGFSSEFVLIEKNALGPGEPFNSMMLTNHHHVVINGTEVLTRDMLEMNLNCKAVSLDKSIPVYNFITENRSYYTLSGMKTVSWARDEYDEMHGKKFDVQ